jgi:citrate synthase
MSSQTPAPPYSPGLAGVIAGESAICCVHDDAGLLYRGYDIHEIATRITFEQLTWLLIHGELPSGQELQSIRDTLAAESELPGPVVGMLRLMPGAAHPVDMLRTGVSMLASFDPQLNDNSHAANVAKSIRLIAKFPAMITSGWRLISGRQPYPAVPNDSYAGRLMHGILGHQPEPHLVDAMNQMLAMYAEHEFNASTFAARVTASTLADLYAATTSGLGTLKGPLHGGANEEAMKMLFDVGTADRAETWLMERLAHKDKVMGFGHRVYKKGDSRVPMARDLARDLARRVGKENWIDICQRLEAVMEREKGLYANLDLYAAPALYLMGVPQELNICIFAAGRVAGWCAHVIEQHDHNRLIRPRCIYTGPEQRKYPG